MLYTPTWQFPNRKHESTHDEFSVGMVVRQRVATSITCVILALALPLQIVDHGGGHRFAARYIRYVFVGHWNLERKTWGCRKVRTDFIYFLLWEDVSFQRRCPGMESHQVSFMSCIEFYHQTIVAVTDLSELMAPKVSFGAQHHQDDITCLKRPGIPRFTFIFHCLREGEHV